MLDAITQRMIPLGILTQPLTFRFLLDTPFGFTTQDLTLDIPELSLDFDKVQRFASSIWRLTYGSALSNAVGCSIATVVNWKASSSLIMTVPISGGVGAINTPPATQKQTGVLVLHTGHGDSFARRRLYMSGMPRNWQFDGQLNGTGQTQLYNAAATWWMAFKGTALPNPYRWLIAYPRAVEAGETNFFGVAFRQVEWVRVCAHTGKPQEGAGLDWP